MAERTRPIRIEFCVTEQERRLIQSKMAQLGTRNMGAYLRKMAIDGYIIKVDYTQQKKLAAAVSRAASNINQICRQEAAMPRMSKKRKEEWAFFLNDRGRIAYNALCRRCVHDCKQSFRAAVIVCPHYHSKRSNRPP